MAAATTDAPAKGGGLTALDWAVIVAAGVCLVVLTVWMIQGQPIPKAVAGLRPPPKD